MSTRGTAFPDGASPEQVADFVTKFDEAVKKLDALNAQLVKALKAFSHASGEEKHILTTAQAMQFTNCSSRTKLSRWTAKFAPFARVSNNRYYRARLEIGRARELATAPKEVTKS